MTSPALRLGADVLYTLTTTDCDAIDAAYPLPPPFAPQTRSAVAAGTVLPAKVTRLNGSTSQNLHVVLDGIGAHWAQGVVEGTGPGTWAWPA
jgi:hypothetical protein